MRCRGSGVLAGVAVLVGAAVVLLPGQAAAAGRTLTVGPHGRYATPQQAVDAARPGDTVAIAAGRYRGGLVFRRSGTEQAPITVTGVDGPAVITGTDGDHGLIAIGGKSWLRLNNLTSSGSPRFGIMADGAHDLVLTRTGVQGSRDGGLVLLNTRNVLIDGAEITGTNSRGPAADHEALSVGSGSAGIEIRNCRVHDNGEEGIDIKYNDAAAATVHDNVVTGNRGPNIYVDSSSGVEIYDNVTAGTRNETKSGIALAVEDYSQSRKLDDIRIYNNVSTGNAQAGLGFWIESSGTMSNISVVNNTFAGNARGAVAFDVSRFGGTNLLRNNILAEGPVAQRDFRADHNVIGDPGFVRPSAGDYHLVAGSRAIDAGSATGAPAFDRDHRPRPRGAGVDVGAYER